MSREEAPRLAGKAFTITAEIDLMARDGVLIAQGGAAEGFSLYLKDGRLTFAIRRGRQLSVVMTTESLPPKPSTISAKLVKDGTVTLLADGQPLVSGKTPGPLSKLPGEGLQVGRDDNSAVGDYEPPFTFGGKLRRVVLQLE